MVCVTLKLTFNTDCIKEGKNRQAVDKQLDNNKENRAAHSEIQAALQSLSVKHDTKVILINHYLTPYIQHTQCHTPLLLPECLQIAGCDCCLSVCLLWNGITHYLWRPRVVHAQSLQQDAEMTDRQLDIIIQIFKKTGKKNAILHKTIKITTHYLLCFAIFLYK